MDVYSNMQTALKLANRVVLNRFCIQPVLSTNGPHPIVSSINKYGAPPMINNHYPMYILSNKIHVHNIPVRTHHWDAIDPNPLVYNKHAAPHPPRFRSVSPTFPVCIGAYISYQIVHVDLMVEIVLIFKGWLDIVGTRLGLGAIW